MEIFGGESGVGKLCLRRRLKRGQSFDLVLGFYLTKESHQKEVIRHVIGHRPLVVVLGPPCTGLGHWSHFNRYIRPETLSKSGKVGESLAEFAARICWIQLRASRHFLAENPADSELFHLRCFEELWNIGNVVKRNIPQCALGLLVDGQPIYKNTTLFASSTLLLNPCKGFKCTCSSHGALDGRRWNVDKSKFAQVWPGEMCQRICVGIQALRRQGRRAYLVHDSEVVFPVGRCRPRKNPLGIVSRHRVIYNCPACMRRLHKSHPAHTRHGGPRLFCKHTPSKWLNSANISQ